jgi:hypothetical protein
MFKSAFSIAILVLGIGVTSFGQITIPDSGTAHLESRSLDKSTGVDNYIYATYSFEKAANGRAGLSATRNDWDIQFSTLRSANGKVIGDVFDVTMVTDDRSRILDLGEHELSDVFDIPELPAFDKPGREKSADALTGHVYLVHTADSDSDFYSLFRVDEINSGKSVAISWRRVDSLYR